MGEYLRSRKRLICILAPTVFGIFYMFICMTNLRQSIWFGESYGAYLTHFDAGKIWELTSANGQAPLYYYALKFWAHCFGRSDVAMRFLSVFCGAIALLFAYLWIKYKHGARAAVLACLFLSISPMMLRYGQEMQAPMMTTMLVFAAGYFLQLAVDNGQQKWWIIYAFLVALGLWTSYYTILAWLAQICYLAVIYRKKLIRAKTGLCFGISLILFVPLIVNFWQKINFLTQSDATISAENLMNYWAKLWLYQNATEIQGFRLVLLCLASLLFIGLILQSAKRLKFLLILGILPIFSLFLLNLGGLKVGLHQEQILFAGAGITAASGIAVISKMNEWLNVRGAKKRVKRYRKMAMALFLGATILYTGCAIVGIREIQTKGNRNIDKNISYSANHLFSDIVVADGNDEAPIIVNSPWIYYDLDFYATAKHQVFFLNEQTNYDSPQLKALRDSYFGKINNLDAFLKKHEKIWYVGEANQDGTELTFPRNKYLAKKVVTIGSKDAAPEYEAIEFTAE